MKYCMYVYMYNLYYNNTPQYETTQLYSVGSIDLLVPYNAVQHDTLYIRASTMIVDIQ